MEVFESIVFSLKKSTRAKRWSVEVLPGGEVIVTAPKNLNETKLERFKATFLRQHTDWILQAISKQKNKKPDVFLGYGVNDYRRLKGEAKKLVEGRLAYFNQFYNFKWNTVFIKNQKSRWGSCSTNKNLNFNYKIVLLPPYMSDYIIVHELCHLGQMNHSKDFWELVTRTIPNHKNIRKDFKIQNFKID